LACYDIAGRAPKKRFVDGPRLGKGETAVFVDGFNVYAGDAIDGRDRKRVERICRYLARPPIAMERLTETGDGDELRYELKKVWRDGTRFVTLDPYELLARICAMVPPPWFNMIRFHGVFAPNAKLRGQVVASARPYVPVQENAAPNPLQLPLFGELFKERDVSRTRRKPWAWLLRHVFAIDVNVCSQCAGPMKRREVAECVREAHRSERERPSGSSPCRFRRNVACEKARSLRELAHVLTSAAVWVCPQVEKNRHEQPSIIAKRRSSRSDVREDTRLRR
jgi:Putative transposase